MFLDRNNLYCTLSLNLAQHRFLGFLRWHQTSRSCPLDDDIAMRDLLFFVPRWWNIPGVVAILIVWFVAFMDSPRFARRIKHRFSSLPLIFERQILTLDPKVTCMISFTRIPQSFICKQLEKYFMRTRCRGLMLLCRKTIRHFGDAIFRMHLCY